MKKPISLVLALMLTLSLAACGGNSTTTPPPSSSTPDSTPSENTGGELYDISNEQIKAAKLNPKTYMGDPVTGAERDTMIAAIPAEMKKGIGTPISWGCNIQRDKSDGYVLGLQFKVSGPDDFNTLKDYYKSLGCKVRVDTELNFQADFDWGHISQCDYTDSDKTIRITIGINPMQAR